MNTHQYAHNVKFLTRFLFISVVSGISVGMAGVILILYAINIGANSSQIGLLRGLENTGALLTVMPMGFLVDHFGAKKIFTAGSAMGVVMYGFLPNTATIFYLTAIVGLLGLLMSFRFVCMNSVFFNALPVIGADKSGWHRAASSFGMSFLGPLLGGYVVSDFGYKAAFYSVSAILGISGVAAYLFFENHERRSQSQVEEHPPIRTLFSNPKFVNACIGEFAGSATMSTFNTFAVVLALQVLHFSHPGAMMVLSLNGIVFILSLFLAGKYLHKYGESRGLKLSIVLIIIAMLLIGGVEHPAALWAGATILAAGIALQTVINLSIIGSGENAKGKVAGVFGFFPVTGMAAGPLIGGFIANNFGLRASFLAIVPLFIILSINYSRIKTTHISSYIRMNKTLLTRIEWKDKLLALIVPLLVLAAWQGAVSLQLFSETLLVPPLTVVNTLADLARTGELTDNILASLQRVLIGFSLGASAGFIVGLLMGLSSFIDRLVGPLIKACKQVPLFAWMPLIILWFGLEELSKVVFIAIGAFYPMVFNTYEGVSGVPKKYRELAKVFNYKSHRYLTKVIIPCALPSIITGARLSLSISWMFVVGAELFGSDSGVGFMMTWARQLFQIDIVMAGLVVVGVIGLLMNFILQIIEKRLLRWRVSFDGRPV
ncbi:MAG: MFS transporter [Chlorobiales bacterium]|nr:MFS transporter [Chlorobiales bacterium]